VMEGGSRYRKPLTAEEEEVLVASTITKNRRLIEHKCHEINEAHTRCLVKFYNLGTII
jgi:hypothetical protein